MMKFKKSMTVLAVLSMVAIILAGCGQSKNTQKEQPDTASKEDEKIVATIGDEQVTAGDLNIFLRQMEMQYEGMFGPDVWDQEVEDGKTVVDITKENALKTAEDIAIYRLLGIKDGMTIPEDELKKMEELAPTLLEQFGEDSGITLASIKRALESEYYRQQMFDREMADFPINQDELQTILTSNPSYQKFNDYEIEDLAKKVRARHILISTLDDQQQPLAEEELNKKKTLAEEVLAKVNAGEDFATLAKEYSEDPGSKDNGGEYTFARGEMVKEFTDSAFGLNPGENSELVKTQFGYHIIKLEEVIEPTEEATQAVKDQKQKLVDDATMQLKQTEFQKRFDEWKKDYEVKINQEVYDTMEVKQSRNAKPEETNPEGSDGEDSQTEESSADDTKADDSKADDTKADDTKADDASDKE